MNRLECFGAGAPLAVIAWLFAASICAASPVQIAVHPPFVRIGETARIDLTWHEAMPEGAKVECTVSGGSVRAAGGGYLFTPPGKAGRAFVHLVVREGDKVWGESAVPVLVYQQFVLLKADDFCATPPEGAEHWKRYVNEVVVRRGIKTCMGVIGDQVSEPSAEFRRWVGTWQASGLVEFFNHGCDHSRTLPNDPLSKLVWGSMTADMAQGRKGYPPGTTYEFQGTPMEEQLAHLARTQHIMRDLFGIQMRCFGAPFNKWDKSTPRALREVGQNMDVWFSGWAGSGLFIIPRGGGEIEGSDGVPSVDCYLKSHDAGQKAVFLQVHPPLEPFIKGWDQFLDILNRVSAGGGVFMLPGEYADLCRTGMLPLEPRALIPDPALECAVRMSLNKWSDPLAAEDLSGIKSLEWCWREPRIRSLAGFQQFRNLRDANLRGNVVADIKPVSDLWASVKQEIDVAMQGNPLPDDFVRDQVPRLEAQGLRIHSSGTCDNVLFTLRTEGQGSVEPKPGDYIQPRGSVMIVRAKPAPGWKIDGWDGAPGMEDKEEVDVFLPAYCVIAARFVPISGKTPSKPAVKAPAGPAPKK